MRTAGLTDLAHYDVLGFTLPAKGVSRPDASASSPCGAPRLRETNYSPAIVGSAGSLINGLQLRAIDCTIATVPAVNLEQGAILGRTNCGVLAKYRLC